MLTCGDHAPVEAIPKSQQGDPLHDDPRALASAPPFLPDGLLNKLTARAFNQAWYRKAPSHREGELQASSRSSTLSMAVRTGTASMVLRASFKTSSPCPMKQPT